MSGYEKVLNSLKTKKNKYNKFKKHNAPKKRDFGKTTCICKQCGRTGQGVIRKYNLNYCRQCFREIANKIGFKKLN
ncbi:MAG: 30S ribosomal protein S14 [Candidatus Aenigmarchaeota archaeon]|nr:30S ribosomal protein S14 [Candidatus Aenigmarchaeota archaeon]